MSIRESLKIVEENRTALQAERRSMGIDEEFISNLVETFYSKIRNHPELGPIFSDEIGDSWDFHLRKMKEFWASLILRTGTYSGQPMPAHQKLVGVVPAHFKEWLHLFRSTLNELSPSPAVTEIFMAKANQIAARLERVVCGSDVGRPTS